MVSVPGLILRRDSRSGTADFKSAEAAQTHAAEAAEDTTRPETGKTPCDQAASTASAEEASFSETAEAREVAARAT